MAVLALAVALAVQLPLYVSSPPGTAPIASAGPMITFRTDAGAADIAAAGARILAGYTAFSLARGPQAAMDLLRAEGHYALPVQGASTLRLLGGDVDVAALAGQRRASWIPDTRGDAAGVIHFIGPIDASWEGEIASRGVTVLRYLPTDGLLVKAPPAVLDSLRSLPSVDYVGAYAPSWKVRPGLPGDGTFVDAVIVALPGEPTSAIEAWLAHRGVPSRPGTPDGPGLIGAFGSGELQWVRARLDSRLILDLAGLPWVEFVDRAYVPRALNAETDWIIQTNQNLTNGTGNYRYWWYGLNGRGQVIGVADTGLDYDGAQFRQSPGAITVGDLYNTTDPSRRKVVRYLDMGVLTGRVAWPGTGGYWDPYSIMDCAYDGADNGHGTAVVSTLAGNDLGIGTSPNNGNALAAQVYMEDVGGLPATSSCATASEGLIYLPQDYADLFGLPGLSYNDPLAPVRIFSNSWGAPTNVYGIGSAAVDAFLWSHPDLSVFFAAGNGGPNLRTVYMPATAKNVVSVGGTCNPDGTLTGCSQNDVAGFSSRGPTADGRIAPTILTVAAGDSATSDGNAWSNVVTSPDHGWAGTSYATPAAAAAAAIVRQYFTDGWYPSAAPVSANGFSPSAALIRAMLIASGVQVTGSGAATTNTWPNDDQGFGRVLLSNVLPIAAAGDAFRTQVVDQTAGLVTGESRSYTFHVNPSSATLKFVIAWTDYPAALQAAKALVNDLDLQVTAPNGTAYRGNNFGTFAWGQSVPGGTFDATNNEEAVIVKAPASGDWKVQVIGANVPVGPQPFALVTTGGLDPNYGRVLLDKATYSESDTVHVTVLDGDATAVRVLVASTLEATGENVTLTQAAPGSPWRGSMPTALGQPAADGVLQVRAGDTITVVYQDASPAHLSTATAIVDAVTPAITGVRASQIDATSARIAWTTNRPASSTVRYGTDPANLASTVGDPDLVISHGFSLVRLSADTLYYYDVVSADHVGHVTVDANGGSHYTFRTSAWGDVLVVIGDDTFPAVREASYADALTALGWTWSFWHVADLGLPPLAALQGVRAVVWQVGLEQYPTFNTTARGLVKAYLDGGGRLLVSSHDTSWSLGSASSPWYTPATSAWLAGVLKVGFGCDPTATNDIQGVAGDPVSGTWSGPTGIAYTPHRQGGADDQLVFPNGGPDAGGTSFLEWTDTGTAPTCKNNQPVGLRWVSAAANGTAGVGLWGGSPSRLDYFAFEITGLDTNATDLRPASPIRAAVLDNAVRWLVGNATGSLDRDHPDVTVSAPAAGTYAGPTIGVAWNATAYGPGLIVAAVDLAYSPDGGQTWQPLAALPGSARTYAWDVSALPNGNAYRVRVSAYDSGLPSLEGANVTARAISLLRPGGDTQGPLIVPGSIAVSPYAPGAAALATVNASADDSRRGGGAIAAAELFFNATQPPAASFGIGVAMSAADGTYDASFENLTWTGAFAAAPGATCLWVHAEDAAGNWGPFASRCFPVISVGPDTVPPAPAELASIAYANAGADLAVTWGRAWDDTLYGGTVRYRVLRGGLPSGPYVQAGADIPAAQNVTYDFVDTGRGAADPSDWYYRIETFDAAGNARMSPALAAKFRMPVVPGLGLLGLPADPGRATLDDLARGLTWSDAWTYDNCAGGFRWSFAQPGSSGSLGLRAGRGLWFNATASGDLTLLGITAEKAQLRLCAGWNLVAVPGFTNLTVAALQAATGATRVLGYGGLGTYSSTVLTPSDALLPGEGFWVYVPKDAIWAVPGW